MSSTSASLAAVIVALTPGSGRLLEPEAPDEPAVDRSQPLTWPQHPSAFFGEGFTDAEVWSACGPIAAAGLAAYHELAVDAPDLLRNARRWGWTIAGGMNGSPNFLRLLDDGLSLGTDYASRDRALALIGQGVPVVISTPKHYFLAQRLEQGLLDTGNTGLALAGGQRYLSLEGIERLGGGINAYIIVTGPLRGPWPAKAFAAAQRAGIDPILFEHQMRLESASYDEAVIYCRRDSPAGAKGIAQLMPQYHPQAIACHPDLALDYAANLMASHLRRYDGSWRLALAAYNAGAGAVAQYGTVPPFAETQTYVRRILGE